MLQVAVFHLLGPLLNSPEPEASKLVPVTQVLVYPLGVLELQQQGQILNLIKS